MKFKEATDQLFARVTHAELARALGVSIAAIRQARLSTKAKAYRAPPPEWLPAVNRLADKRAAELRRLIDELKNNSR
jgi:hypothetical protein